MTAYVATMHWKRVRIYLGTREGSILNVQRSDGFGILICLHPRESFFAEVGWSTKTLSNEQLLIVLSRQIDFYRGQKAAAIDCFATSAGSFDRPNNIQSSTQCNTVQTSPGDNTRPPIGSNIILWASFHTRTNTYTVIVSHMRWYPKYSGLVPPSIQKLC
jgi:hypothetical protein